MTTLTQFTTAVDIRAVLGVSPEEITDATLASPMYLRQLQFVLADIDAGLEADYLAIAALSSRSAAQQKLFDVMQVFAPYAIARVLLPSMPIFAPRRITDGRAEMERVVDPYKDIKDGIEAGFNDMKERLMDAYEALGNTLTISIPTSVWVAASPRGVDPVTGS